MRKVEAIIHPVRLRILLELTGEPLTTQEISERLEDVPVSSIYRHLKILLDEELIAVTDTRLVKGVQEKTYKVVQNTFLGPADMADLSADEHMHYFTTYILTLLQGYQAYLNHREEKIDLLADRVGYTEVAFWASDAEMDEFSQILNQSLLPLLTQPTAKNRRRRKLATISYPLD